MLKLPEIENKQMYSTVKDGKPLFVDHKMKEDIIKSMIESRNIESPADPKSIEPKIVK